MVGGTELLDRRRPHRDHPAAAPECSPWRHHEFGVRPGLGRRLLRGVTGVLREVSNTSTSTCTDLVEGLFAGFRRANGRFLEESAVVSRRVTDDLMVDGRAWVLAADVDYDQLADPGG